MAVWLRWPMPMRHLHALPGRPFQVHAYCRDGALRGSARLTSSSPLSIDRRLSTESLPRIAQPSFWKSLVPSFSKTRQGTEVEEPQPKKKDWNPATFFIVMVMLIGSQAIQMIALRQDFVHFSNQSDAKLAKLREVVNRIENGEKVDVAAALGTGDKVAEREWEEVIRELEQEDELYRVKRRKSRGTSITATPPGSATENDDALDSQIKG